MVAICRGAGVYTIVDAAHSIGQEPDINLSKAKPDFWVSVSTQKLKSSVLILMRIYDRTVINGFMQREDAPFFMFLRGPRS